MTGMLLGPVACILLMGSAVHSQRHIHGDKIKIQSVFLHADYCPKAEAMIPPVGFKLNFTMIFMRHGIRSPSFASNWTDMKKLFPEGFRNLTKTGIIKTKELGCIFRKYYGSFLPTDLSQVGIFSSSAERCVESMAFFLQWLFPRQNLKEDNREFVIQSDDDLKQVCSREQRDIHDYYNLTDPILTEHNFKNFGELQDWLIAKSGYPDYAEVHNRVVDAFVAYRYNNVPLPAWAADYYDAINFSLRVVISTGRLKNIDGVNLLRWFHARMMEGATGSKVKMYVLSYHDTTLIPILKFMNIDTIKHFPRFSASLHFQVFTRAAGSGVPVVRIVYFEGLREDLIHFPPVYLTIPGCGVTPFGGSLATLYSQYNKSVESDVLECSERLLTGW